MFGLLVMATGGTGKLWMSGETTVALVVLLDDEVPPTAEGLGFLKKAAEGASQATLVTFGHWSRGKLGAWAIC
jgi:hypothetical protein